MTGQSKCGTKGMDRCTGPLPTFPSKNYVKRTSFAQRPSRAFERLRKSFHVSPDILIDTRPIQKARAWPASLSRGLPSPIPTFKKFTLLRKVFFSGASKSVNGPTLLKEKNGRAISGRGPHDAETPRGFPGKWPYFPNLNHLVAGSLRSFPQDSWSLIQFYRVKRMISGSGAVTAFTDSQTLNR